MRSLYSSEPEEIFKQSQIAAKGPAINRIKRVFDSSLRVSPSIQSSSDFYINTKETISGRYELQYAFIPNTYYNVASGVNNSIPFFENSTSKVATIAPGCYDPNSIISALTSALNTASSGYNTYQATFSQISLGYTFTAGNAFQFQWGTKSSIVVDGTARLLGFTPQTDTATATTITSNLVVTFTYPTSFYILIDNNYNVNQAVNTPYGQGTYIIPSNVNSGGVIEWTPTNSFPQSADIASSTNLRIRLLDSQGRTISLNGADWFFILS